MGETDLAHVELGDYQTPDVLARQVVDVIAARGFEPRSVVEPTCGGGSFVIAAARRFPTAERLLAVELQEGYFRQTEERILKESETVASLVRLSGPRT